MIEPKLCYDCEYYGIPIKITKHQGKEKTAVHECELHEGCFNTKFSGACKDFVLASDAVRSRRVSAYGQDE